MLTFKIFLENEEDQNIKDTLRKLPQKHSDLVHGFTFTLKSGNTLPGDDEHIGYMDRKPKEICVAAPWNYPREFTLLHEIAHLVWDKMPQQLKKKWFSLVDSVKSKEKDNREGFKQTDDELFCMTYAQFYSNNKMVKYDHKELLNFIKSL